MTPIFNPFPKMARFSKPVIITEKIDGTNASIFITPGKDEPKSIHGWYDSQTRTDMVMFAGSRTRWITPEDDNHGFARWAKAHAEELAELGSGHHFGEWWGQGIQRGYGLTEKRFSLFNVSRWCLAGDTPQRIPNEDPRIVKMQDILPACCHLVPLLEYCQTMNTLDIEDALAWLVRNGSAAAPGFMNPEGIVAFHVAGNVGFKKTIGNDGRKGGR